MTCNILLTKDIRKGVQGAFTEATIKLDGIDQYVYWCRECAEKPDAVIPDDGTSMRTNFDGRVVMTTQSEMIVKQRKYDIRGYNTNQFAAKVPADQTLLGFMEPGTLRIAA